MKHLTAALLTLTLTLTPTPTHAKPLKLTATITPTTTTITTTRPNATTLLIHCLTPYWDGTSIPTGNLKTLTRQDRTLTFPTQTPGHTTGDPATCTAETQDRHGRTTDRLTFTIPQENHAP